MNQNVRDYLQVRVNEIINLKSKSEQYEQLMILLNFSYEAGIDDGRSQMLDYVKKCISKWRILGWKI